MKDLMTAYDEARFGKTAADDERGTLSRMADYFAMSKLTPENRELRDTLEESIREEKRLRDEAKGEISSAKKRLKQPASTGGLSWLFDLARSVVPGFALTAAPKDDGIVKGAVEVDDAGPSPIGTLAHATAGGLGALGGAGVQRGWFGGMRGAQEAAQYYPRKMENVVSNIAQEVDVSDAVRKRIAKDLKKLTPEELALVAQGKPGGIMGYLRKIFEPISDLSTGSKIGQRAAAEAKLTGLLSKGVGAVDPKVQQALPKAIKEIQKGFRRSTKRTIPTLGWKTGAGIGAAALTLPFVLYNLIRARRVRAQGGPATGAARRRAEQMLAAADKQRAEREKLLAKLPK